jgi:hypothetical protein
LEAGSFELQIGGIEVPHGCNQAGRRANRNLEKNKPDDGSIVIEFNIQSWAAKEESGGKEESTNSMPKLHGAAVVFGMNSKRIKHTSTCCTDKTR